MQYSIQPSECRSDNTESAGSKFKYRLKQIDSDGKYEYLTTIEVEIHPTQYSISQNYPNPFNPSTTIRFGLPVRSNVVVTIYNQLSEIVEVLMDRELATGFHSATWNAGNLASGLYFYELRTEKFTSVKKLLLMK